MLCKPDLTKLVWDWRSYLGSIARIEVNTFDLQTVDMS